MSARPTRVAPTSTFGTRPARISAPRAAGGSYAEILKSSALIGGSSLVNLLIGVARTKALAVLLGPAGYGLMGAYQLIVELTRCVAQLGLNSSGVRQIAQASATGDLVRTAKTAAVLRGAALASAVLGAAGLALLAPKVSLATFGSVDRASEVIVLSLAVFFTLIAGGQLALLQGLRRVSEIATLGIVGTALSSLLTVALIYQVGQRGVALSFVASAAVLVLVGWWYRRKVLLPAAALTVQQTLVQSAALLKLGFAFMLSGLLMAGTMYVVRTILLQQAGLEAAGLYQAAWTVGGLYVAYVLQAMSSDFYPRLVAKIDSPQDCNRLVNEQACVSFLLGGPGILATLAFAPYVVAVLYSAKFAGAVEVLRWICLGMALRIVSYPMGYILVAKNRQRLFVGTDLAWACFNVGMTYWGVIRFGVVGAGMAYAASYVLHCLMVYPIAHRLTGFSWSRDNRTVLLIFIGLIAAVFAAPYVLPAPYVGGFGIAAFLLSSGHSLSKLARLPGLPPLPNAISSTLLAFGSWRNGR
jgi:enterobacterial common antigen flippase